MEILKDFLKSIVNYAIFGVVYIALMALFAWMQSWNWFFIVVVGMGALYITIGFGGTASAIVVAWLKTTFGAIMTLLAALYMTYFSIHAVWTALPMSTGKEITVNIIATIVFVITYLIAVIGCVGVIFSKNHD